MLRRLLKRANHMGFTFHRYDLDSLQGRQFRINYFTTAGLNDIVFTIFLPPNPGRLVPCILGNVGTILCYQTSNVILINATLLLVHFFIMSKFYVYVLCVRVCIV